MIIQLDGSQEEKVVAYFRRQTTHDELEALVIYISSAKIYKC